MNRGDIYWVNLEPSAPAVLGKVELGKVRPGIIVSNTLQNKILGSVVIVPLSSRAPEIWPLRLRLRMSQKGTSRESYAVIPGMRQVSKARLQQRIGSASAKDLERITEALTFYLQD